MIAYIILVYVIYEIGVSLMMHKFLFRHIFSFLVTAFPYLWDMKCVEAWRKQFYRNVR